MRTPILIAAACLTLVLGSAVSAPAHADGWRHKSYGHGHFNKRPHKVFVHRHDHGDNLLAAVGIIAGAQVISSYLESTRPAAPSVVYVAPRQCYQTYVGYPQPYGGIAWVPQVQCY